jgi:hypothetical protein
MTAILRSAALGAVCVLFCVSTSHAGDGALTHHGPKMHGAGLLPFQYGSTFQNGVPFGWGYLGYGGFFNPFPTVDWQYWLEYYRIPYYAKHPPVYYSYPFPRTYGYSPYAYPAGTRTPEISAGAPLTMQNKYVPEVKSTQPPRNRVAVVPLREKNPYVDAQGPTASLAAASRSN